VPFGWGAAPIRRARDGTFEVRLEDWERQLLAGLPGQMRDLLDTDDPALERLYPPAYLTDDEKNEEYRRLMRGDLTASRLGALDVLEATLGDERLTEEQLGAWMGAVNDVRLVLGTRLDVTEDLYETGLPDGDPREAAFQLYGYLGYLLESIVEALASAL